MKKSSLRAFGIACFVIGLLIFISQKFNLPFVGSDESKTEEQYESKIAQLEQQLEEANQQLSQFEQTNQTTTTDVQAEKQVSDEENTDSNAEETITDTETTDEEVTDTLYIYGGLTPSEIAQKLKDMGIIKNSVEMELFLAQREYATSIQKGQFELSSSMTIEEIANIITGKSQIQ